MAETDLIKLYSSRILALATQIPHATRLKDPDATVKKRSPLCGSTVTVDIVMENGKVAAFGQDVKACALGQSAAAILGSIVIGRSTEELEKAAAELRAMLKDTGPVPSDPFGEFEVLKPAREYKNRHASILLALEAAAEAAHIAQEGTVKQ